MNKVLRIENKYLLDYLEFRKYSNYFSGVLMEDPHNGVDGYIVRSLYFDTMDDKDFNEKEDGVFLRKKIRLRVYDPNSNYALLEMKQKEGNNQMKRSLKVKKSDAIDLINGDYSCLLKYSEEFALECYTYMTTNFYKPKVVVQYNRKAFIAKENNTRITFDNNIVATETNFNIFDKNLVLYPVFPKNNIVLEVKYNGFLLSYIKDLVSKVSKIQTSASKYALARMVSKNYLYI